MTTKPFDFAHWNWSSALRESLPVWVGSLVFCGAVPGLAGPAVPQPARAAIEQMVHAQRAGLPGTTVLTLHERALPACDGDYDAFLPTGTVPRGRVSIGLRCLGDEPWTRFVAAHVAVRGRYLVATRAIAAGETLRPGLFAERTGDLSRLPRSVVTDGSALRTGMTSTQRMAAGAPLRQEALRSAAQIQRGQTVQIVAAGAGFAISTEGKALNEAADGAPVQARTRDGRLLTGVADAHGRVQVTR